jgi:hypothetical protein
MAVVVLLFPLVRQSSRIPARLISRLELRMNGAEEVLASRLAMVPAVNPSSQLQAGLPPVKARPRVLSPAVGELPVARLPWQLTTALTETPEKCQFLPELLLMATLGVWQLPRAQQREQLLAFFYKLVQVLLRAADPCGSLPDQQVATVLLASCFWLVATTLPAVMPLRLLSKVAVALALKVALC